MRDATRLWIGMSNREESMARVLSRADLPEGAVFHAHRAASCSLIAVLAERGFAHTSDRCGDLCGLLDAHNVPPPKDAADAAEALDRHAEKLAVDAAGEAPSRACTVQVAEECLDCARRIRNFVNAALTR